jgi:hypothetical protein
MLVQNIKSVTMGFDESEEVGKLTPELKKK